MERAVETPGPIGTKKRNEKKGFYIIVKIEGLTN